MARDDGITPEQYEAAREARIHDLTLKYAATDMRNEAMKAHPINKPTAKPQWTTRPDGHAPSTASGPAPKGGFARRDGPPPKPMGRAADPLVAEIAGLKPGEWLAVCPTRVKKTQMPARIAAARRRGGHPGLHHYTAENGDLVVAVDATRTPRVRRGK